MPSMYLCLIDNMNEQIIQSTEMVFSRGGIQYLSYGQKNTGQTVNKIIYQRSTHYINKDVKDKSW